MKTSVDIGLIVAMKEEADILASSIGLRQNKTQKGNFLTYTNSLNDIVLLTPGLDNLYQSYGNPISRVGKVSAGVITTLLIEHYHPRVIINAGTAGGIKSSGVNIGEIIVADSVSNHDVHIPSEGYNEYGIRKISTTNLKKLAVISQLYKTGLVSSGESFSATSIEWKTMKKNKALVKEMEAAGIFQAMQILGSTTPVYFIKSITDINDEDIYVKKSSEEFLMNFKFAMKQLSSFIKEMIDNKKIL